MANDWALIPCEICNKLFPIDQYVTHTATHDPYNSGSMYPTSKPVDPSVGGVGPMNKPPGYKDPHPNSQITIDDYTTKNTTPKDLGYQVLPNGDVSYNEGDMYGGTTDKKTDDNKDDEKANEIQDIKEKSAASIRDNGCCVIPNGMRKDLISNSLRIINNALQNGKDVLKQDEYTKNREIMDLFSDSAAYSLAQNVVGLTNVVTPKIANIQLLFPEKQAMDEKDMEEMEMNWKIDGLDKGQLAPFTLGMRMVLTQQKFRFYKGSHKVIHQQLKEMGMEKFIEMNKNSKDRQMLEDEEKQQYKLEVVEVNKGDIVLYHPFLCMPLVEKNDTENIDYYVEFKVNHKDFNDKVGKRRCEHLWLGYEKLNDALLGEVLKI